MDFFERQGQARKRTTLLVVGFALAVAFVVTAVDAVVWGVLRLFDDAPADPLAWLATPTGWLTTGIVLLAILGTSVFRGLQLAHGGGGRVALLMGGEMIDPYTAEGDEAVLINVVEEMAIASGVTVPDVYVLEREGVVNAFAAGTHPANAVITVTRGLLDQLDRDALQGVIAHEFSHILNGDIRLNIRLIGMLAGITVISEIGTAPWRAAAATHHGVHRGFGGGHPALLVAGLVLIVIGWFGLFAGRVIKAAVSRQREFLADAAAVQFTRNPDGLASALLTIHQGGRDSRLLASHAEEISHMGFGRTVGGMTGLTRTHPPIEARMRALGPKYEMWFRQGERDRRQREREEAEASRAEANDAGTGGATTAAGPLMEGLGGSDAVSAALSAAAVAGLAGETGGAAVDHARALLRRLPDEILEALHTPTGAADAVAALMLHGEATRERDLAAVARDRRDAVKRLRLALESDCPGDDGTCSIAAAIRLPMLELALRSLRRLDTAARDAFLQQIDAQIRADGRVSLFEYAARSLLRHELVDDETRGVGMDPVGDHADDANIVLSLLAHAGGGDEAQRRAAHERATAPLLGRDAGALLPVGEWGLKAFSAALERCARIQPVGKRSLLVACSDCIGADGIVRASEAELVRIIAAVLDTPMPPVTGPAS